MSEHGLRTIEYEAGNDADRIEKLKSIQKEFGKEVRPRTKEIEYTDLLANRPSARETEVKKDRCEPQPSFAAFQETEKNKSGKMIGDVMRAVDVSKENTEWVEKEGNDAEKDK